MKVAAPVIIVPENRFGDDAAANKRGSPWSHTESIANILVCDLGQMAFSSMDMSRSKSYGEDDEHVDDGLEPLGQWTASGAEWKARRRVRVQSVGSVE